MGVMTKAVPQTSPCPGRPRGFDEASVLDAALQLFRRQGYEATSLDALTQAMGIGRSSLYACFGSKRGVLLAALRAYSSAALDTLSARISPEMAPEQAVRELLDALADPCGGPHGCLLVNCITELAPHDAEVAALGQRHLDAIEGAFARVLAPENPKAARDRGRALAALALGTLTLRKSGMEPARISAALAQATALTQPLHP